MYNVSNEYKNAMKSHVQRARITGTINGESFGDDNILRGSFHITNQCSGNANVEIGQVYIGQLDITIINMEFARNILQNKDIIPFYGRKISSGYEDIPLGVFSIGEANRTASGIVIKAYDNMKKLDKSCGAESAEGTPFTLAQMACNHCKVKLGTTEQEFATFSNGTRRLSMYTENDIETWRDFLSWLAAACGCFVYADRQGYIRFKAYGNEVVDTIDNYQRLKGASFSDFTTRYTGISCVNIADKTTSYYGLEKDDGLTYNLGSNPFLQYGVEATVEEMRRNVLNAISVINYIPFESSMLGDPSYDLGDVIQFREGIAPSTGISCITYFSWTYNQNYKAKGVGENPALASARSKTDKDISGLISNIQDQGIHFSQFVNAEKIIVESGQKLPIINHAFASNEKGHIMIDMQLCMETSSDEFETDDAYIEDDTVVSISYTLDGETVAMERPIETYQDLMHVIRLRHDLELLDKSIHRWVVHLESLGGTVTIEPYNALNVIMGNGIAGSGEWDGTIDVEEFFDAFSLDGFIGEFRDSAETRFVDVDNNSMNDTMQYFGIAGAFGAFSDVASVVLE